MPTNQSPVGSTPPPAPEEKGKTCCCVSYERGVTPCLCGCHSKHYARIEGERDEAIRLLNEMVDTDLDTPAGYAIWEKVEQWLAKHTTSSPQGK